MVRRTMERKPRGEYRHGNLRRALLDGVVIMLADTNPEQIGLRELSRRLGVDHRAAYRHFADREALLEAVAEEGYRELITRLAAGLAVAPAATTVPRLLAFARVYIQFAIREPGRYRAMTSRPRANEGKNRVRDAGDEALALLVGEIAAGVATGELVEADVLETAVALWSAMHGLATLIATRRLYVRRDLVAAYTERIVQRALYGLVRR